MHAAQKMGWCALLLAAALAIALGAAGCGTPGAPLPPSLNLPEAVTDLAAARAGNSVSLSWTMPKQNTDKTLLTGHVTARVCRKPTAADECATAGTLELAPGAAGTFTDALPSELASGTPRALTYYVELLNRKGRSAGLSNAAPVLAGAAPAPVTGLTAEARKEGVVLSWDADREEAASTAVRLHRTLLTPQPAAEQQQGLPARSQEPVERSLLVQAGARPAGRALDSEIDLGKTYEYRAQRVIRMAVNGQTLELAGELSAPVRVETQDIYPPAAPTGLAAVAAGGGNGAETAIDLSWRPNAETDLAGYIVYRREADGAWERISPAEPVATPAYHDAHVRTGRAYSYAVSAVGRNGRESARSDEATETVPPQ